MSRYQSKEILAGAGVAVQKFVVVSDKAQVAKKVDGFSTNYSILAWFTC